jgi:O-6-methylguanine DNA methyltransferase
MDAWVRFLVFPTRLGWILTAAGPAGLCLLDLLGPLQPSDPEVQDLLQRVYPNTPLRSGSGYALLEQVKEAILQYLSDGTPLPSIPLDLSHGTPFQKKVWEALSQIPFGETRTYLKTARTIGHPRSARAVGQACGRNPIAIIIPCHRVVGSGGGLGGYGGGLPIKKVLLELERKTAGAP